jgi:chromosome segregation ATPase
MSNDEMSTKPTIETVIERMNNWGDRLALGQERLRATVGDLHKGQDELRKGQDELRKGQDELRKGQDELRKGQDELRADLNAGLHRVSRKIEILNDNILTVQADIRDLVVRMEKLEGESFAPK